jgi:hypothetical protein
LLRCIFPHVFNDIHALRSLMLARISAMTSAFLRAAVPTGVSGEWLAVSAPFTKSRTG